MGGPTNLGPANLQQVLEKGHLLLNAQIEIELASGAVGKPISLSPDLWYGVTDKLTVGLVHSTLGATGIMGGVGDSLCLTGKNNGCGFVTGTGANETVKSYVYDNVGLDGRYQLTSTPKSAWAVDAGIFFSDFVTSTTLDLKVGADGRYKFGKLALDVDPSIFIALNNRGGAHTEQLIVPVTAVYPVIPKLAIALQVGLLLPFSDTGDAWSLPVSIGVQVPVTPKFNVGLAFSLPELAGGSALDTGTDDRSLTIGGGYAF